ncbi:MAG: ABC transporter permease subunit [Treponema sp.]|nr:ABC transporter permease subunit [Treponema sp.]
MSFSFSYLIECLSYGIKYIHISLLLAFLPLSIGTIFGTLIAISRIFKVPALSHFFSIFIPIYNGIPGIVSLFIYNLIYLLFFKPTVTGVIWVAIFTFSLGQTTHLSESIRGAFLAIPKGQYEACSSIGLTTFQSLKRIIIPQVIPVIIPSFTNMTVGAIKNSSIVFAIGVTEVLNGATIPCGTTYSYLEGYVAAAIIYWILNIIAENLLRIAEKKTAKYRTGEKI